VRAEAPAGLPLDSPTLSDCVDPEDANDEEDRS